ncbi:MAG: TM2 domain-containing protein [Candidatus Cloacimonetes bacterium]|nr:TM2 domain-containing protein [Candidatus Cloacimonadota bacterium]
MDLFDNRSPRKLNTAYWLTCLSFFGFSGVQRFYLGKPISGIIWFLTGGLFFMGTLYDLITLPNQVRELNLLLGYDPHQQYEDPSIIEANYTVVRETPVPPSSTPIKPKSIEAQVIELAETAEMNQLNLKDLIKAGISLQDGKRVLENFAKEGVCEEVSMDGMKIYCF